MNGPRPELPVLYSIHEDAVAPLVAAAVLVGVGLGGPRSVPRPPGHADAPVRRDGLPGAAAPEAALGECEGKLELARAGIYAVSRAIDNKHASGQPAGGRHAPHVARRHYLGRIGD